MAMASSDPASGSIRQPSTFPISNLRNPLPLSAAQENEVRKLYHKRLRTKCAPEIQAFVDCAKGRTFSTAWACRAQHFSMNSCMVSHATPAEEDAAREEWFTGVQDRRRKDQEELAAVERRRAEVIELTRKQEEKERLAAEAKLAQASGEKAQPNANAKGGWFR